MVPEAALVPGPVAPSPIFKATDLGLSFSQGVISGSWLLSSHTLYQRPFRLPLLHEKAFVSVIGTTLDPRG